MLVSKLELWCLTSYLKNTILHTCGHSECSFELYPLHLIYPTYCKVSYFIGPWGFRLIHDFLPTKFENQTHATSSEDPNLVPRKTFFNFNSVSCRKYPLPRYMLKMESLSPSPRAQHASSDDRWYHAALGWPGCRSGTGNYSKPDRLHWWAYLLPSQKGTPDGLPDRQVQTLFKEGGSSDTHAAQWTQGEHTLCVRDYPRGRTCPLYILKPNSPSPVSYKSI